MKPLITLLVCLPLFAFSQEIYKNNHLEGYWTGAMIKGGNSVQIVVGDIYKEKDTFYIASSIPDWPNYPPLTSKVVLNNQSLEFDTYYGKATMALDSTHGEMVGTIGDNIPPISFHLKKSLKPNIPKVSTQELKMNVGDITLDATLVLPTNLSKKVPLAIIVHGRGCSTRDWQVNRAKKLAEYGLAVLCFDKRGSKSTDIDCNSTTLTQHAADITAILKQAAQFKEIDKSKIGLIGYSAGGWVAPKVAGINEGKLAFMITVVGPSTSIKQQQIDGAIYSGKTYGTTPKGEEQVVKYTELMFSTTNLDEAYQEMEALLKDAKQENWLQWLEDTDIPKSAADIPNLWVNRFDNYDPAVDLANFNPPFLSILGEEDYIVPYREQITAFKDIFGKANKTNYRIVVAAAAGHGMENGALVRDLKYNRELRTRPYYYKFDRVSYGSIHEIITFLRDYEILDNK